MIAVGMDLVEIDRIAGVIVRHGWRFFDKCFTPAELIAAEGRVEAIAARFAAKEAAAKALGTGIGRVSWREVEVLNQGTGQPVLQLHGEAAVIAQNLQLVDFSVTLSHTRKYAAAVVIAAGVDRQA